MGAIARALALIAAAAAALALPAAPAPAQTAPPPVFTEVDANGVDLASGQVAWSLTEGRIGAGEGALSLVRTWAGAAGWTDNWSGRAYRLGGELVVEFGGVSDRFSISGTAFTSRKGDGATLEAVAGGYLYRAADGTAIAYTTVAPELGYPIDGPGCLGDAGTCGIPTEVTRPSGLKFTLDWDLIEKCSQYDPELNCLDGGAFFRFDGVTSSAGYSFSVDHATDAPGNFSVPQPDWYRRVRVTFTNLVSPPAALPTVSYAYPSATVIEVTDSGGRLWRLTGGAGGRLSGVRRPGAAADSASWSYGAAGVASATVDGVASSYSAATTATTRTVTVTDALGRQSSVAIDLAIGRASSVTDPLNRTTSFQYDSKGRPIRTTLPEGNAVELTYDARGNVTRTRAVAKPGSALPDITASAAYPPTCANPVTCNKPSSTTDARGAVTDYAYDPVHGGLLSVTLPAPTSAPGAVRPQTRIGYAQVTAIPGQPVWLPVSTSACRTLASCAGGADEVRTTVAYETANLLPAGMSSGNGTGTLTATSAMTYDAIGNLLSVDGPLPGTADTLRYRWNSARERTGTLGPDPDGAGPLKPRAEAVTINSEGLVARVERGTLASQSTDWATFAAAEAVETSYDADARPLASRLTAAGSTYALTQTSWDPLGRPDCVARRMNPAEFATPPASACTLDTAGSFGPDRIVRTLYDAAGQVSQVRTALGTADEAAETTTTYRPNGQAETVTDGENNKTTYEYDGHDRLVKTRFPAAAKGAGTSSASDYEQYGYEILANPGRTSALVVSLRNRGGDVIGFAYDLLGRLVGKDRPGAEPDVGYGYDNLGRLVSATQPGEDMAFGWDALGRLVSQTNPAGAVAASYDLAGRLTRLEWPDHAFVAYDHLVTGETAKVRYNGATSGPDLLATYGYDSLGRRTSLSRGNGTSTSYAYDAVSRIAQMAHNLGGAATTQDLTLGFAYDPAGGIASVTRSNDLYAWTKHGSGTTSTTANGRNQLASWNAPLAYDAKGNLTSDGTNGFGYSSENLLTSLTVPPWGTVAMGYDPLMRFAESGGSRFLRFGDALIGEYYQGALVGRFVPGADLDETVARLSGSGVRNWYYPDERGSTLAVAGDSGTATSLIAYDEYGRPGATEPPRIGYTGKLLLSFGSLYDYRNRTYHAGLGRFLQPDPIGYEAGMNLFAYVAGDPVNLSDPSGLAKVCVTPAGTRIQSCVNVVDDDGRDIPIRSEDKAEIEARLDFIANTTPVDFYYLVSSHRNVRFVQTGHFDRAVQKFGSALGVVLGVLTHPLLSLFELGGDSLPVTTLYRAVGTAELSAIRENGMAYTILTGGTEGKYFYATYEQAARFITLNQLAGYRDPAMTVTSAAFPSRSLPGPSYIAGEGMGYFLPAELFPYGPVIINPKPPR